MSYVVLVVWAQSILNRYGYHRLASVRCLHYVSSGPRLINKFS